MQPTAKSLASSTGLGSSPIIIIVWLLSLAGIAVPPDVAAAMASLGAAIAVYFIHRAPAIDVTALAAGLSAAAPKPDAQAGFARLPIVIAISVLALLSLAACGTGPSTVFQALKDDDADVCATVTTSVAGYAGGLTFCRAKSSNGGTVSVDKAGVTTITRNGQPVASAAPKPPAG